jgi:predicted protein tyrosine phosphatase
MFTLAICGLNELPDKIDSFAPTHILSVITHIEPQPGHHMHIAISDVPMPMDGHVHPTMEHLQQVLAFTEHLTDDDRLLIHCYAGQSRSTACALAALIQHGMDFREAFDHVSVMRAIMLPNALIVHLTDEYFGLNGEFDQLLKDYYAGHFQRARDMHQATTVKEAIPSQSDVNFMRNLLSILN